MLEPRPRRAQGVPVAGDLQPVRGDFQHRWACSSLRWAGGCAGCPTGASRRRPGLGEGRDAIERCGGWPPAGTPELPLSSVLSGTARVGMPLCGPHPRLGVRGCWRGAGGPNSVAEVRGEDTLPAHTLLPGPKGCSLPCCHGRLSPSEGTCVHVLFSSSALLKAPQAVGQGLPLSHASSGFTLLKEQLWAGRDPHHLPPQSLGSRAVLRCVPCMGPCSHVQHNWASTSPGVPLQPCHHSPRSRETPRPCSSAATREVSCEGLWQAYRGVRILRAPSCPCGAIAFLLARFLLLISGLERTAAPWSRGRHLIVSGVDTAL